VSFLKCTHRQVVAMTTAGCVPVAGIARRAHSPAHRSPHPSELPVAACRHVLVESATPTSALVSGEGLVLQQHASALAAPQPWPMATQTEAAAAVAATAGPAGRWCQDAGAARIKTGVITARVVTDAGSACAACAASAASAASAAFAASAACAACAACANVAVASPPKAAPMRRSLSPLRAACHSKHTRAQSLSPPPWKCVRPLMQVSQPQASRPGPARALTPPPRVVSPPRRVVYTVQRPHRSSPRQPTTQQPLATSSVLLPISATCATAAVQPPSAKQTWSREREPPPPSPLQPCRFPSSSRKVESSTTLSHWELQAIAREQEEWETNSTPSLWELQVRDKRAEASGAVHDCREPEAEASWSCSRSESLGQGVAMASQRQGRDLPSQGQSQGQGRSQGQFIHDSHGLGLREDEGRFLGSFCVEATEAAEVAGASVLDSTHGGMAPCGSGEPCWVDESRAPNEYADVSKIASAATLPLWTLHLPMDDAKVRDLAARALRGQVASELLQQLSRHELISLLGAHAKAQKFRHDVPFDAHGAEREAPTDGIGRTELGNASQQDSTSVRRMSSCARRTLTPPGAKSLVGTPIVMAAAEPHRGHQHCSHGGTAVLFGGKNTAARAYREVHNDRMRSGP